jgi:predicted DNA binding CopG/RHH family protein
MKNKTHDKNMPIGKLTKIVDYLPPPSELVQAEDNVKITILIKKSSINFFKKQANRYHTKYQKMMREVLDRYATSHQ